jgi:hypothetical protein
MTMVSFVLFTVKEIHGLSNLSYVTFQENIEIGSLNAGLINIKCTVKGN